MLSFLKGEDEEEEEEGKVPLSVKRALLTARQALTSQNFMQAEQAYHQALGLLMLSPHAASQPYIEATAVVLDLVRMAGGEVEHLVHLFTFPSFISASQLLSRARKVG